jgi:hypothetical protein
MKVLEYLKARMAERSTWAAISAAVVGAAAVAAPYSYILIGVGVIGAVVPEPAAKDQTNG